MEIKKQTIIAINITCVFRTIKHAEVNFAAFKDALTVDASEVAETVNIEKPQYHVTNLPGSKYTVTVEGNRLIVDDRSGAPLGESALVSQFQKILQLGFQSSEITSYGFNIMTQVEFDAEHNFLKHAYDFFVPEFTKDISFLSLNAGMSYKKYGLTYQAQLSPLAPHAMGLNFNAHRDIGVLPTSEVLNEQLSESWKECQSVFSALK